MRLKAELAGAGAEGIEAAAAVAGRLLQRQRARQSGRGERTENQAQLQCHVLLLPGVLATAAFARALKEPTSSSVTLQ